MIHQENLDLPAGAVHIDELICNSEVITAYEARFDGKWPELAEQAGLTAPRYLDGMAREFEDELWNASLWYPRERQTFRRAISDCMNLYPSGVTARMHEPYRGVMAPKPYDTARQVYEAADDTSREFGIPEVLLLSALRKKLMVLTDAYSPSYAADFLAAQELPGSLHHAVHVHHDWHVYDWAKSRPDAATAMEGIQAASSIIAVNAMRVVYDHQLLKRALAARKLGADAAIDSLGDIIEHASSSEASEAMLEHIALLEDGEAPRSRYRAVYPPRIDGPTRHEVLPQRDRAIAARFDARLPKWLADAQAATERNQRAMDRAPEPDYVDNLLREASEHAQNATAMQEQALREGETAERYTAQADALLKSIGFGPNREEELSASLPQMLMRLQPEYRKRLAHFDATEILRAMKLVRLMREQAPNLSDADIFNTLETGALSHNTPIEEARVVHILRIIAQDAIHDTTEFPF